MCQGVIMMFSEVTAGLIRAAENLNLHLIEMGPWTNLIRLEFGDQQLPPGQFCRKED